MGQKHLRVWLGAGLLTAGVSGAVFLGAGVATAEIPSGSDSRSSAGSQSTASRGGASDRETGFKKAPGPRTESPSHSREASQVRTRARTRGHVSDSDRHGRYGAEKPPSTAKGEPTADRALLSPEPGTGGNTEHVVNRPGDPDTSPTVTGEEAGKEAGQRSRTASEESADLKKADEVDGAVMMAVEATVDAVDPADLPSAAVPDGVAAEFVDAERAVRNSGTAQVISERSGPVVEASAAAPQPSSVVDMVGAAIGSVVNRVGSTAFDLLGAVVRVIDGPPVLPAGSTVTVQSSRLQITEDLSVETNWYYPTTGEPPDRLVLLQHGFLATGPMYSYTAAMLAEQSNSIVVTPSLPTNPFAADDLWLGGKGMERAVADLFVGDRDALTSSAVAAGYAEAYGLDPDTAVLPRPFAMAGHSLGGGLVSGAAGYLVDNGAVVDLVGVITLDGVPPGDSLPNALVKLAEYEQHEDGRYVPVREIGAGGGLLAGISQRDAAFEARPDRYNGVVLVDGVHMDAMQGGNPIIQFLAYLFAGFPQQQNQAAVQQLAVTWLDEWFAGETGVGDELEPGETITIETPLGPAYGVVVGASTGEPLSDPSVVNSVVAPVTALAVGAAAAATAQDIARRDPR